MEEKIKIYCFGQEVIITMNQLVNLKPFITS
jgi:hypothetical protein